MASWRGALLCGLILTALASAQVSGIVHAQAPSSSPATSGPPAAVPASPGPKPQGDSRRGTDEPTPPVAAEARPAAHPPSPPADPTAAAVYAVLEKHCARCHQGGRLERPAPAAAFGNVLRLDELAMTPSLVQPGNPDASRLYLMMLRRLMPPDATADGASRPLPTPDEIAHVRSWISGLDVHRQCPERRPVTVADHAATLSQLPTATGEDPKKLRFLSIAHLHNGCTQSVTLAAYRQAIVRLFNSLSWKSAPVAVPAVDPAGTLFKINLDDLGWLPEHWERIMRSGSSPLGLTAPLPPEIRQVYGTDIPVARADWFAKTVLSAPLYYEVLGLPGTGPEILKILQVQPPPAAEAGKGVRALAAERWFSPQPSLVERLQSRFGPLWQTFHWLPGEEMPDIDAENVPKPADISPPFQAARGMFTLPNGLPAFFLIGQRGDRLDALPPGIATPTVSGGAPIMGGLDCMACHGGGPVIVDAAGTPPAHSVSRAIAFDSKAIAEAMRRIGIDPGLTLDGVTPVVALAAAYARPVDGARAAAELGVGLTALANLGDRGADPVSILARRLVQGLVARGEVEAHARELAAALGRPQIDTSSEPGRPATAGFEPIGPDPGLILFSDKVHYRKGDTLKITVRAASECHLTIVSVDTRGRGTVLFPSDFESNNLLSAGQELKLPGPDAPYTLRLNEAGRETIVALCNQAGSSTDNIRFDFERQRFTELGDYATFLAQNALVDRADTQPDPSSASRRGHRHALEAAPGTRLRRDQISRTAISIIVE